MLAAIQAGAPDTNGPGSAGWEADYQVSKLASTKSGTVAAGDKDADAFDCQQFHRFFIPGHIRGRGLIFSQAITDADHLYLIFCGNLVDDIQKALVIWVRGL